MQLKILDVIQRIPEVRTLRFERPASFDFKPGQFVLLSVPINGVLEKRAYSIASSPTEQGILDVTLKRVEGGKCSPVFYDQKPGTLMEVKGPYGLFTFDKTHMENMVLIAGGTGVTPMRSIIKFIADTKMVARVSLIEGARRPQELIYHDEFEEIHKDNPDIGIYFTVNSPEGEYWPWHQGHITIDFIKESVHDLLGATYYLCGPGKMVENLMHDLEHVGVNPSQIHTDRW
jgi:glycine betaine catabolism B